MSNKLVVYHEDADGFAAAWVVSKVKGYENAIFMPWSYGDPLPDVTGKDVTILDIQLSRDKVEMMQARAKKFLMFEHHQQSVDEISDMMGVFVDTRASGCGLAWAYFFPGVNMPKVVAYVQDRDLWRFALPNSREVNAYIDSVPKHFDAWHILDATLANNMIGAVKMGEAIRGYCYHMMEDIIRKNVQLVAFCGHVVPFCNSSVLASELGEALSKGGDLFAVIWEDKGDKFTFHLRSDSDFDVSAIAKHFGGGGHPRAAGFEIDREHGWDIVQGGESVGW